MAFGPIVSAAPGVSPATPHSPTEISVGIALAVCRGVVGPRECASASQITA
jgi:hypothetical protein